MRNLVPEALLADESPHVAALRELIGCPIDWEKTPAIAVRPVMLAHLLEYWVYVAEQFQSDMEMRFYARQYVAEYIATFPYEFETKILGAIRANSVYWRDKAEREYRERAGFLERLTFADWTTYSKHRPPRGKSQQEIVKLTKGSGSISYFFEDGVIQRCEELMWRAISSDLINVLEIRPEHLFVEDEYVLGACNGTTCKTMRIDIDYKTPQAHGHPRLADTAEGQATPSTAFPSWKAYSGNSALINNIDWPPTKDGDQMLAWLNSKGWRN